MISQKGTLEAIEIMPNTCLYFSLQLSHTVKIIKLLVLVHVLKNPTVF